MIKANNVPSQAFHSHVMLATNAQLQKTYFNLPVHSKTKFETSQSCYFLRHETLLLVRESVRMTTIIISESHKEYGAREVCI